VIISLLTAWVVLVLYFVHIPVYSYDQLGADQLNALSRIFKLAVLYGGFAFIISLIREVVKDMEDMPGDARYGCRTMPIVWGMQVSRVFIATWVVVLIASILIILVYVLPYKWWWPSIYCTLLILIPLGLLLQRLFKARSPADFHRLSSMIKAIMLTGILSILFFNLYA
ncbi:MAG TPA: UbiA family prenyltransferase, partial [Chitinophagaceae bacterium]|nr:UbiA family prenyltransferase [Chitinophagaceae bacterium]